MKLQRAAQILKMLALSLIIGFAADLVLFNFSTFTSLGNREVKPTSTSTYTQNGDVFYEYVFDTAHVGNIRLQTDLPEDFQGTGSVTISIQDQANADYVTVNQGGGSRMWLGHDVTYDLEASGGVKRILIHVNPVVPSGALHLSDNGLVARSDAGDSYARFYDDAVAKGLNSDDATQLARDQVLHEAEVKASIPVQLTASFNVVRPLSMGADRVLGVAAAALLLMLLLPSSTLWGRRFDDRRFLVAVGAVGAALVAVFAAMHLSFVNPELLNEQQYYQLAQALAKGHLYLDAQPSAELMAMENPYDSVSRITNEVPYLWDHAYFGGRYYVYFGVLPTLIYHLPWYLLTGGMFPNAAADAISGAAFAAGLAFLLAGVCRRWFRSCSQGMFLAMYLLLFVGSWTYFIGYYPGHYVLPIATGLAVLVWGLALWVRATDGADGGGIDPRLAAAGSLLVALTVASRPQLLAGGAFGIVLLVDAVRRQGVRACLAPLVAALLPFAAVFAAVGWYNAARFGSPLDFGANYNLTTDDMTHRGMAVSRLTDGVFFYLFQLPAVVQNWPYLRPTLVLTGPLTILVRENMYGGLLTLFPPLVAPAALVLRRFRDRVPGEVAAISAVGVLLAVLLAAFDSNGAGILPRYLLDVGFFLAFAAVLALLSLAGCGNATGERMVEVVPFDERDAKRARGRGIGAVLVIAAPAERAARDRWRYTPFGLLLAIGLTVALTFQVLLLL